LEKLSLKGKKAPNKEEKIKFRMELKKIEEIKSSEIKVQIKKEFNYQIPIAEVEKAGISSTGTQIENELEPLVQEFKIYRITKKLWGS
jgi:type I restriction enzyme M protein